jgi:ribose transport system ATP-binding protein
LDGEKNNLYILEMKNITKNFPGVKALDDVSIAFKRGQIAGLLGENGAGKSTLIKILSGDYSLEEGEIHIDGEKVHFSNPAESIEKGIRVIYQELNTFDSLTVVENIFAGEVIKDKLGLVRWGKMLRESREILRGLGSELNPSELMENLTVAEKQLVEIAKAIRKKAKILVMDEPTSALPEKDVMNLYKVMRKLRDDGVLIIYISHRMEEIFEITDTVTVLRDSRKIGSAITAETDKKSLVNMIVGRDLSEQYPKKDIKKGPVIFEAKDISYMDKIKDISFSVRAGEIVAFFGLLGAGTHNLFKVLFGDKKKTGGSVFVEGKKVEIGHPYLAKINKLGYIPFDRKMEGVALTMNVRENITSAKVEDLGSGFVLNKKIEKKDAQEWYQKMKIKAPGIETVTNSLSGGNQQKVVVAKWLARNSKIFLMNEPTRGIDIGSKSEIYEIAEDLCEQGAAVLLVSSELPEILAISDRVIVMRDGHIVDEFVTKETSQEELMHAASA